MRENPSDLDRLVPLSEVLEALWEPSHVYFDAEGNFLSERFAANMEMRARVRRIKSGSTQPPAAPERKSSVAPKSTVVPTPAPSRQRRSLIGKFRGRSEPARH